MSRLWPKGLSSHKTDSRRGLRFTLRNAAPGVSEGSLSGREAQIHHFLLLFLEPPGDCPSQKARGDQEAGRQGRGLPGSHPAPAPQAAAAEGPRETWKSLPARPVQTPLKFHVPLDCALCLPGPRGSFQTRQEGPSLTGLWVDRESSCGQCPLLPRPAPGNTSSFTDRERIPTATAGQ